MNKNFGLKHSFVEDEVEEGEEVEEDVPSLLSLEQTNGQDHLLLGEVGRNKFAVVLSCSILRMQK